MIPEYQLNPLAVELLRFLIPFAAAYVGARLAYSNMLKKQRFDEELKKLSNANKLFLQASDCLESLLVIRALYSQLENSAGRGFLIQPFPVVFPTVKVEIENLTFMSISVKTGHDKLEMDLLAVSGAFQNYNLTLERWKNRASSTLAMINEIAGEKTFESVMFDGDRSFDNTRIFDTFNRVKMLNVLKDTESAIQATENTIKDLAKIVNHWPSSVMARIDRKLLKKEFLILHRKSDFQCPQEISTFDLPQLLQFLSKTKN